MLEDRCLSCIGCGTKRYRSHLERMLCITCTDGEHHVDIIDWADTTSTGSVTGTSAIWPPTKTNAPSSGRSSRAENGPPGHRCLLVTPESAPAPIRLHSTCFARVRAWARPKRATSTSASNLQSAEFHAAVAATSPASPSSGFERNLETVIPTHRPERVSVKRGVLADAGCGFAVRGAGSSSPGRTRRRRQRTFSRSIRTRSTRRSGRRL